MASLQASIAACNNLYEQELQGSVGYAVHGGVAWWRSPLRTYSCNVKSSVNKFQKIESWDTTSISLTAGCDLFMRYVTRTSALEYEDFNSAKSRLIERAEKFGEISYKARKIIAMLSQDFIFDGCTILVHGFSRVVLEVLKTAAENRKLFRVLCTEGRPDRTGLRLANELAKLDVPVKLLIDSAVAYSMDEIDMVFVGADGVVESGGIINMMGTYQIALVAHSMNKPVYVAAESYKKLMLRSDRAKINKLRQELLSELGNINFIKVSLWNPVTALRISHPKHFLFPCCRSFSARIFHCRLPHHCPLHSHHTLRRNSVCSPAAKSYKTMAYLGKLGDYSLL
ncbi:hypothetical protein HYC85_027844 [Camellia sinensis]|uniref:Translation initiation factor eIF2B subunit alpha n=1 Tax=Camellia sinensis TaxID=4442 RepID=A0A7J7FTF4_CAMSI|nr:hypothetical protein HYC85_027844 [Camellia sinensis]